MHLKTRVYGMVLHIYAARIPNAMLYVHTHVQGYDMEDAMILNKASVERGLAHASVYKSEVRVHF